MKLLRLALLICDNPVAQVLETEGNYYAIYGKYLRVSLDHYRSSTHSDIDFKLDGYDIRHKQEYPNLDNYDGILITGSAASAYENLAWIENLVNFMASAIKSHPHISTIAICFGHQILARALGGQCTVNNGIWETGVYEMNLTDIGQEVFGTRSINIQQMHRDHVPSLPTEKDGAAISLLGSTPLTLNQGFILRRPSSKPSNGPSSIQVLALQGHPEYTQSIVSAIVDARGPRGTGVMSEEVVTEGKDRAGWRNDGVTIIGKAVWDVLSSRS